MPYSIVNHGRTYAQRFARVFRVFGAPRHDLQSASLSTHILSQVFGGKKTTTIHKHHSLDTFPPLVSSRLLFGPLYLWLAFRSLPLCMPMPHHHISNETCIDMFLPFSFLQIIVASHNELRCPECRVLIEIKIDNLPPNVLLMRILGGNHPWFEISSH